MARFGTGFKLLLSCHSLIVLSLSLYHGVSKYGFILANGVMGRLISPKALTLGFLHSILFSTYLIDFKAMSVPRSK